MIFDESQYGSRIGIQIIVYKIVVDTVQSFEPSVRLFILGRVDFVEEAEIHDCFQVTVARGGEFGVFLPPGCIGRFGNPGFAHRVVVGVFFVQFFHPVAHGIVIGIRVGVHPDAVDIGVLNPPQAVLQEVFVYVRVLLVEVRHGFHEPAVVHLVEIVLRGIRIYMWSQLVGSLHKVVLEVRMVEPVL